METIIENRTWIAWLAKVNGVNGNFDSKTLVTYQTTIAENCKILCSERS